MWVQIILGFLGLADHYLTLAQKMRDNAKLRGELTPDEEAQIDGKVAALKAAPASDPNLNA